MIDLDEKLIKSPHVRSLCGGNSVIVWHSLFGRPQIVPTETLGFIDLFSEPSTMRTQLGDNLTDEDINVLAELLRCRFLIPEHFDERKFLASKMMERESEIANGSLIDNLSLIMSEECNFRCDYCIHFKNLETSSRADSRVKFMRFETAKEAIDGFLKILRDNGKHVAEINFGGGEPLLAWPVIKKVLEYCDMSYGSAFSFKFSINTNASLITPAIAEMLKKYHFEISSSLDGLQKGNDKVRSMKLGGDTFSEIVGGFENLQQVGYPLKGFSVTVTENNFGDIDESIIDWAMNRGINEVRVDIDVVDTVSIPVEEIVAKLMHIRRYAKERGIDVPGFWSRPAENLNESVLDNNVAFCGAARGNSMCVSPSGDIYGCGYSTTKLDHLSEISAFHAPGKAYARFVKEHFAGSIKMCKGCIIEGQCIGGCNITREFASAVGNNKLEPMCNLYRRMTEELLLEQLHDVEVL